jgi:hypothetical protein
MQVATEKATGVELLKPDGAQIMPPWALDVGHGFIEVNVSQMNFGLALVTFLLSMPDYSLLEWKCLL